MLFDFDATLKSLVRDRPLDWVKAFGMTPTGPVKMLSPDLSTVTKFADIVLHLGDRLLQIDFQSGPDAELPQRLLLYNVLLFYNHGLPVHTVVVLLRPRADRGDLTNRVTYAGHPGRGKLEFEFEIVRLWLEPVESLESAGVGLLPLAILGRLPEGVPTHEALTAVVQRIVRRMEAEGGPLELMLKTAAFLLSGLRVSRDEALLLFQGVRGMRESTTYQYILDEGRNEGLVKGRDEGLAKGRKEGEMQGRVFEARQILLRQGRIRFGEPDAAAVAAIEAVADPERLERLAERLLLVTTWKELLATV